MVRLTELVHRGDIVREVKQKFPESAGVFEKFGLWQACHDCSIEEAARRGGAMLDLLLAEVNEAIYISREITA